MWSILRPPRQELVAGGPQTPSAAPTNNNSNNRSHQINDDATLNPRPRNRRRQSLPLDQTRCCECSRHAKCSSASQTTHCACRNAGRDCTDCLANKNCCNRSSDDDVSDTPERDGQTSPPLQKTTPRRYDDALHVFRSMQHCFQRRQNLRRTQTKQKPPR